MKHKNFSLGRRSTSIQEQIYSINALDPTKLRPGYLAWDKSSGQWKYKDETGTIQVLGGPSGGGAVDSVFARRGDITARADDYDVAKITGLQTALDGKVAKAGDTMTGNLTINSRANNMFRLNATNSKTIAIGADGNLLPEFSITGTPGSDYVFNLFTDPAAGVATDAWSLSFKIASGNIGLTDPAGDPVTPLADEDLATKKYVDITKKSSLVTGHMANIPGSPTMAEFNNLTKKVNQILDALNEVDIIEVT